MVSYSLFSSCINCVKEVKLNSFRPTQILCCCWIIMLIFGNLFQKLFIRESWPLSGAHLHDSLYSWSLRSTTIYIPSLLCSVKRLLLCHCCCVSDHSSSLDWLSLEHYEVVAGQMDGRALWYSECIQNTTPPLPNPPTSNIQRGTTKSERRY